MERALEAARLIAPTTTWRRTLASAVLEATRGVFVGVHTCPPEHRQAASACFAPLELEERARALSEKILPRLERRFTSERWARFHGRAFSLFDEIGDTRFVRDILRDQRASGVEGVLNAFFRDESGATIGGITLATRQPGREALAAYGEGLAEVAAIASQTLCSAIDLAVRCGAVIMPAASQTVATLSKREQEIVQLVRGGYSDLNIAERLGISEHTVGAHLRRVYRKLSVHRRVDLVMLAGWGAPSGLSAARSPVASRRRRRSS